MFHTIEEAIDDLKQGKMVIVVDDEDRENEGDFVALADTVTPEMINFMITYGKGLVCTPITEQLADKLDIPLMTSKNTDPYGTAFTVSIDHVETTTGISASERALTIKALTDPNVKRNEFKSPGHVFPLIAKEGGVLKRAGHTEAAIDLAKLSGAFPASVICEIIHEDGTMARVPDLIQISQQFDMKLITIKDLISYRKRYGNLIKKEVETMLPTKYGPFKMIGYSNKLDNKEHIALVKGETHSDEPVLVRIHSECLTGDVFHSSRCDCGPQLDQALQMIQNRGNGILIYMRQEGRGIGLFNKMRAYNLQHEGFDTVEANEALGFPADIREYEISAQILRDLQAINVELITNNPRKLNALQENNIHVVNRVETKPAIQKENRNYLHTKQQKLGHLLSLK